MSSDPDAAIQYWSELFDGRTTPGAVELAEATQIVVAPGATESLAAMQFDVVAPPGDGAGAEIKREVDPDGWTLAFREVEEIRPVSARDFEGPMLSHCTLNSPAPKPQREFYERLQFRVSDALGGFFYWLRCNPIHHSVAFASHEQVGIHHIAIELPDRVAFIDAIDRVVAAGHRLEFGPGRHMVGGNLFAYFRDRYGLRWELCCEMGRIEDPEYVPQQLTEADRARSVNTFGVPPPQSFIEESGGPGPASSSPTKANGASRRPRPR